VGLAWKATPSPRPDSGARADPRRYGAAMTEPTTPTRFHEADGVEDRRVLFGGAHADVATWMGRD
jgi:hypothetical protein